MRIALIHTRLLLRGGLESRLFSYMNYFNAAGHDVTVFVYKIGDGVSVTQGVKLEKVSLGLTPKPFRAYVFDRKLKPLIAAGDFDLVISLGRTTCHDAMIVAGNHLAYMQARGWRFKGISDRMQILMDDKAYRAKGTLLAASEMLKSQMSEFHDVDAEQIKVLYPPTNPSRFHQGLKKRKKEYRKKHGFSEHKRSFLFVSANHKLKGLPLLSKIFPELMGENVELLIVGGGDVPAISSNVRHLGFVKEMEELYAAADFLILPSLYDSFGQVVTEALLCGTPVIISDMTGAKAVVTEKEGIVVHGFGPKAWKTAILNALQKDFEIDVDFAANRGLSFEQHMQGLLACART